MTSIGLRPALLFFSLTGVNTAASISARKLSNGTTRAIISSGSPFAESPQAACQHRRIQIAPSSPHSRILLSQVRLAQIRGGRYFSRCPSYDPGTELRLCHVLGSNRTVWPTLNL